MKITKVRVYVAGKAQIPLNEAGRASLKYEDREYDSAAPLPEKIIANPMSIYPEYIANRASWMGMGNRVFVQIETDEGISGLGETTGGKATAAVIKEHLSYFLLGQSPFQVERLWDMMFRVSLPYGRKGIAIMAISGIDLALWDLIAKARNEPLYQTLGGPVRDKIQCYVTGVHLNEYTKIKDVGYLGYKIPMPYGPASGAEGMAKNVETVKSVRETLGPDMEIMLDCYMAWDVDYTIKLAELVAPYRVKWIEESLPPDDYQGYGIINSQVTASTIATGEHEYTRYGFQQLFEARGAGIIQPDLLWCGGLTEARKIGAMASARHIPVIPHASGLQMWTLHWAFAEQNIPMTEYAYAVGVGNEFQHPAFEGLQTPKDGWFSLPQGIGAGIELRDTPLEPLEEL